MKHQPLMNRITSTGRITRCCCGWNHEAATHRRGRAALRLVVTTLLVAHLRAA